MGDASRRLHPWYLFVSFLHSRRSIVSELGKHLTQTFENLYRRVIDSACLVSDRLSVCYRNSGVSGCEPFGGGGLFSGSSSDSQTRSRFCAMSALKAWVVSFGNPSYAPSGMVT